MVRYTSNGGDTPITDRRELMSDYDSNKSRESFYVPIDVPTLMTINSLGVFAAPDTANTPVIEGLYFSRSGTQWQFFTVHVTNRYVCAEFTTSKVEFHEGDTQWDNDAELWIDKATIKYAANMAKATEKIKGYARVTIGYNSENRTGYISVDDTVIYSPTTTYTYPPVGKLFPTEKPNGVKTVDLNPKWLAMLTKVVGPLTKGGSLKDAPWTFSFFNRDHDGGKSQPVMAHIDSDLWKIKVLIQPNLKIR
jgi:hypothetical protein